MMDDNVERDLLLYDRMKAGDDAARDTLIVNSMDLVDYHANNIAYNKDVYDELMSEGFVQLIKCVDNWEFREKEFKAYATKGVKFAMWRFMKRKYKFFSMVDKENMLYIDREGCDFVNLVEMRHFDDSYDYVDYDQIYEYISDVLTKRQKQIMNLSYFEGLGPTEIAKRLGIKTNNVTTTMKNARKKLQDNFDKEELGIEF